MCCSAAAVHCASCPLRLRSTHPRAPDLSALPAHQPLRRALRQPPAVPAGLLTPVRPGSARAARLPSPRASSVSAHAARLRGADAWAAARRRGGPKSADHVDILGHAGVLEDIGLIAAGHGAEVQDRFVSRVRDIAAAINVEDERPPKR